MNYPEEIAYVETSIKEYEKMLNGTIETRLSYEEKELESVGWLVMNFKSMESYLEGVIAERKDTLELLLEAERQHAAEVLPTSFKRSRPIEQEEATIQLTLPRAPHDRSESSRTL